MIAFVLVFMLGGEPPFNYDKALLSMIDPNRKWSRAYYHKDGTMLGIIQEEWQLSFGLALQERHPFDLPSLDSYNQPKAPFRLIVPIK